MYTHARGLRLVATLGLMLGAKGCLFHIAGAGPTVKMTPEMIHADGRAVFHGTAEQVFKATEDALTALNIGVAVSKPDRELIVSKHFTLSVTAQGTDYTASTYEDTLQYDITVHPLAAGQVEVTATPRAFRNAKEMTDQEVWILDGENGQRPRWQKLFAEVHRMLGA